MIEIIEIGATEVCRLYEDFRPHFNKRIKDFTANKLKTGDVVLALVARETEYINETPVGLTAVYIDEKEHEAGITVVKEQWRNQNIGTNLLKARYLRMPHTLSKVWEGNLPSKRICEKACLKTVGEEEFKDKRILIFKKG